MIAQMNDEIQAIECMTVVGGLSFVPAGASTAGFRANLKCHGARDQRSCGKKQEGPVRLNLTSRGTLLDCLKELHRKLETDHSNCVSAAEAQAEIDLADKMETQSQYVQVITGFLSLETQVMGQVAKKSSQDWDGKARCTRARVSLMEIGLWWSSGGCIVWMRMHLGSLLRSGTQHRLLTRRRTLHQ